MDGGQDFDTAVIGRRVIARAEAAWTSDFHVAPLLDALGCGPFALIALFVTPMADFAATVRAARAMRPGTDILACTTAGEIGTAGYQDGTVVAVGFPADSFCSTSLLIEGIGVVVLPCEIGGTSAILSMHGDPYDKTSET